ncbi:MAG TPA: glycosyltransferase family 2 protein [Gammaproteobacteria bacterium]|jgi:hypothetical protein|nr:glycosyltransferase family 2 protein [Xanthomonadales bacterium]MCB1594921.1 glycosyltransferase family 2 protein [Xanthomonadales bacterium]MCB1603328.1 glycosyltransferase family 2 protein [Xanthomonadales bacterium]HPI95945.1 glycosyltransferase family 2 protein [Gammaproteobacteria bacterium]HPQ87476.1 glycosyltransferase family 2 protein [Gammaproteobacteria bacterium]
MNSLIVIPAFNEETSIGAVIEQLKQDGFNDILVVNDCSTDTTAQIVNRLGAGLITLPIQLGAWGATQTGIKYALRNGYDSVITMDADGQHMSEGINRLIDTLQSDQSNVVIGTYTKRLSKAKRIAWRFFKLLTNLKIEDLTSGYRIYDRKAMKVLSSSAATILDYQDVGVLLLLHKSGMVITEVEVPMTERKNGKSKIFYSWWMVFRYMIQTTMLCIAKTGTVRLRSLRK